MSYIDLASKYLGPDQKSKIEQGVTVGITKNGIYNVTPDSQYEATSYVKVKVNTRSASQKTFAQISNIGYNGMLTPNCCGEREFRFDNAESLECMFYGSNIITNPKINARYATDITMMFAESNIQYITRFFDCNKIEYADFCFYGCKYLRCIDAPISMSVVRSLYCAFAKTSLSTIPVCNTKNCRCFKGTFRENNNIRIVNSFDTSGAYLVEGMFGRCSALEYVELLDFSKVISTKGIFDYDSNLTNLGGFKGLKVDLDLHYCDKLTTESIQRVIDAAAIVDNKHLILGISNLNKLSDKQIGDATQKGWILM